MAHVNQTLKKSKLTTRGTLLTSFHILVVLLGLFIWFAAYWLGLLFNALFALLLVLIPAMIVSRGWGAYQKTLEFRFPRRPFNRELRKHLLQCLNLWAFLVLVALTLRLAVVPAQFTSDEYLLIQVMIWGSVGLLMALALFPHKKVRISTNSFFTIGWVFLGIEMLRIFTLPPHSQSIVLYAPFRGEWYVLQGGRSALINHHYPLRGQRYAFDIIKTIHGQEIRGDKTKLESYPAYGQMLYAPADGRVVQIVTDRPDMPMGITDREQIVGNHVVLDIGQGRFVLMAHLKQGSIRVSPGEGVQRGQPVAQCGNSGNSSAPHLHLQVQSHADFNAPDLRTFPILFRNVIRVRSGHREQFEETDVRRNDILLVSEE